MSSSLFYVIIICYNSIYFCNIRYTNKKIIKVGDFLFKTKEEALHFFKNSTYTISKYNKNDIIAIEGSPCDKVGLILQGSIDVKRILTSNNVIHMSSLSEGSFFGEIIAFSDTNAYPATIMASSNCEVMFIHKTSFIIFCTKNPDFLDMFLNDLSNKIIQLNNSIKNLSFSSIRQKLSNYLVTQHTIQKSKFIKLGITKQKLSEMLGIPRPSLSRELMKMKSDGLIDYSKDTIKILDIEALEELLME